MRAISIAILAIVVGAVVGVASAYWRIAPQRASDDIVLARGDLPATKVEYPKFVVDASTHNFGSMQRGTNRQHAFKVTNEGARPLTVEVTSTTCKCTVGDVGDSKVRRIEPGDTADVTLSWVAKAPPGTFRQTATLKTNDPRSRRVELTVEGTVTDLSGVEPKEWFFDDFRPGEVRTESVYVMAYQGEDLVIEEAKVDHEDARDEYRVEFVKVEKEELPDATAKSGYRVDVTPLDNLGLGPLHDWIVLKTNIEGAEEISVPILGNAVGDIEVRGPAAWNDVTGAVHFGNIQSEEGAEVKLFLQVVGEYVDDVQFSVKELDPEELEVEFGDKKSLGDNRAMIPLVLRVPTGLPTAIRNGSAQGEAGRVVLETGHPLHPEISFGVRYIIRNTGVTR